MDGEKRDRLTELALKAASNDESAFEELVYATERTVYNMALRACGGDEHDASDLSQDIYIKLWRSLAGFRGDSSFNTWLFRIVQNAAADRARKAAKERTVSLTVENDGGEEGRDELDIEDTAPTPEAALMESEASASVMRALDSLTENHREIVILRYMDDFSVTEISDILNIDEGTVKSRLFRAREKLKKLLEKGNGFG